MTISFNEVPSPFRAPFFFVEIDPTFAGLDTAQIQFTALVVGQKTAAGSAAVETLIKITDDGQADNLFGAGSHLARILRKFRENNTVTELKAMAVVDDGGAVAAVKTITVTGPATASGTIVLLVAGIRLAIGVASGDSANDIASAIEVALDAELQIPYTASVATNVVTLIAKNAGLLGNDIDVRDSFKDDESLPAGVALAFADTVAGATNPSVTNLIAAMVDEWFQVIVWPWTDSTSLDAIEAELADRFGPIRQLDGVAFSGAIGTLGALATLGNSRNSPHTSIIHATSEPVPHWEKAGAVGARVAQSASIDPARPFQTLTLTGILAPVANDRFTLQERNGLLFDGISTSRILAGDVVQIGRLITTFQTSVSGEASEAFLNVETMYTLQFIRFDFRTFFSNKYPRFKLADDDTRIGEGQKVMTPKLGKAEAIARFRFWEELGLVENFEDFNKNLIVERNTQDKNRLDFLLPPDLINQLIVQAAQIQFRL